jgi:hypothetical protein
MFGGAPPIVKSVFDMDPKTAEFIQFKIDKWHRSYIDWRFYQNATRFFIENRELSRGELIALKIEFDEVFGSGGSGSGGSGSGLMKMVNSISEDYEKLKNHYKDSSSSASSSSASPSGYFKSFIYLFNCLYNEIEKYKDEPLDYVVNHRKPYFPNYSFDKNILDKLLQIVEKFRNVFVQLELLDNLSGDTKDFFETIPYLSQIDTLQSITDEFKQFINVSASTAFKTSFDIFENNMLRSKEFVYKGSKTYIPSFKIILYVYQVLLEKANLFINTTGNGVGNTLYAEDGDDNNPKKTFDKGSNENHVNIVYDKQHTKTQDEQYNRHLKLQDLLMQRHNKDRTIITELGELYHTEDDNVASVINNAPYGGAKGVEKSTQKPVSRPIQTRSAARANVLPVFSMQGPVIFEITEDLKKLTNSIRKLSNELNYDKEDFYDPLLDTSQYDRFKVAIRKVEDKLKEIKGENFVSSLLNYNYDMFKPLVNPTLQSGAATFFRKFYDEAQLANPEEQDSYTFIDNNTVPFSFGVDLIFWLLFRLSKYYFETFHLKFIEKLKEKIGPENAELRSLQTSIQYKESKLNHVSDLVARLIGVPVVRIIPDRSSYLTKTTVWKGFVNTDSSVVNSYQTQWANMIDKSENAAKIKFVTDKMTRGLDKSLGLDPTDPTNEDNTKKKKAALVELLEHNTIQVVHMLFAKPRDIWYSPDMRNVSLTSVSKWSFFRLEKPEIVTKSAFNLLKTTKWDAEIGTPRRLDYILDKSLKIHLSPGDNVYDIDMVSTDSFKNNTLVNHEKPLCALIVASQPSPQMLDPSKDSANESRFQLTSFNAALGSPSAFGFEGDGTGAGEPAINDDHNVGAKLMDKLTGLIKPNPEKCSNVRNLLQEQANEISSMTADIVKSAGVDFSIKAKKLMEDINTKKYTDRIKASLAEAKKAAAAAEEAEKELNDIVAAAGMVVGSGSSPIVFTDVKTAVADARKAADEAAAAAEAAADEAKRAQPNQLEKTADEVKTFETEAIKQSAIAVRGSKEVKEQAFHQVSDGIDKWHNDAGDNLAKSKSEVKDVMNKFKGTLSQILTNMQNPQYSISPTIQKYIAHIKTQISNWDDFTKEIDETYKSLETTELQTIAIKSLKADSPAAEFTTTVATAKGAFDKINNDIKAAVKKVKDKINEINESNKVNIEDKVAEDTAAVAATVSVAVITGKLEQYMKSPTKEIKDAANNIVAAATAAAAVTATAAATAAASNIKDKLDQLLNVENKVAAITAAISAIPLLDNAQQYQGHSFAVLAAVTTAVTAAVGAAQEASTKTTPADTLQLKQKAEAALRKAQALAAGVGAIAARAWRDTPATTYKEKTTKIMNCFSPNNPVKVEENNEPVNRIIIQEFCDYLNYSINDIYKNYTSDVSGVLKHSYDLAFADTSLLLFDNYTPMETLYSKLTDISCALLFGDSIPYVNILKNIIQNIKKTIGMAVRCGQIIEQGAYIHNRNLFFEKSHETKINIYNALPPQDKSKVTDISNLYIDISKKLIIDISGIVLDTMTVNTVHDVVSGSVIVNVKNLRKITLNMIKINNTINEMHNIYQQIKTKHDFIIAALNRAPPPPLPGVSPTASAAASGAPAAVSVNDFLKEIKGIIKEAADALDRVSNPTSQTDPQIPDFTLTSATSSANFREIAENHLRVPAFTIQREFDTRIDKTIAELGPTINEYQNSRKELLENIHYCTNDTTGLTDAINDDKIGSMYNNLQGKYSGYKQYSDDLYTGIHNEVIKITDTGIDNVQQQNATRTLFQNIRDNCTAFAEWVKKHLSEIDVEVPDFVTGVETYVRSTIPVLTKRLIACINRSINTTDNDVRDQYQAINFATLNPLFETGDEDIGEIEQLLADLEVAGP